MSELRECKICGELFVPRTNSHKYCSEECTKESARRNWRTKGEINRAIRKAEKRKSKNKNHEIADIAKKAREAGMSYGEYVARNGM